MAKANLYFVIFTRQLKQTAIIKLYNKTPSPSERVGVRLYNIIIQILSLHLLQNLCLVCSKSVNHNTYNCTQYIHVFYYLKNILLVLLCSLTVTAQNTTDVPVLQEWWRADNMGYGVKYSQFDNGGMTWLDNFYHGKGVLVISTPTGVKTWQLRYPGDTVNIFTWEGTNDWGKYKGPNPRIKTLKCNDDSITDYIDDYGNMYLGIQNGEPPKPKPIFCGITPDYITDFNNDNIDDILSWNTSLTKDSILAYVQYGANNVSEITVDSIRLPTELYTNSDRTVQPISMYKNLQGELRLLLRYRIMDKQDGYRLYAFSKSSNGYTFELKDSYIVSNTNNYVYQGYNTLLTSSQFDKYYWIVAESLNGNSFSKNLVVYDLFKDRFDKILYRRQDSIGTLTSLKNSIDRDVNTDWFLQHYINDTTIEKIFYSGNLTIGFVPICKFSTYSSFPYNIISVPDRNNDTVNDVIIVARNFDVNSFCVLKGITSTLSHINNYNIVENNIVFNYDNIHVKAILKAQSTLELYNLLGQQLLHQDITNKESVTIDVSWLENGVYLCKVGAYSKVFCISR